MPFMGLPETLGGLEVPICDPSKSLQNLFSILEAHSCLFVGLPETKGGLDLPISA